MRSIDIGKEEIEPFESSIEDILGNFFYQGETYSLMHLMQELVSAEAYAMGDLIEQSYLAVRQGMQIFKVIYAQLGDLVDLNQQIKDSDNTADDPVLDSKRGFCGNYAGMGAAGFISHRMEAILLSSGHEDERQRDELEQLELDHSVPEEVAIKRMLAPVFLKLIRHIKHQETIDDNIHYLNYIKEVFQHYADTCQQAQQQYLTYYDECACQFHLMGEFQVPYPRAEQSDLLETSATDIVEPSVITPKIETTGPSYLLPGNPHAEKIVRRHLDRLALYDTQRKKNPILEFGGLSWSLLFEGQPGSGKTGLLRWSMDYLQYRFQQVGINGRIVTLDQAVQEAQQGLQSILGQAGDASQISLFLFDDIDLLGNAENTYMISQYLDGLSTPPFRGNVINFATANQCPHMRSRFWQLVRLDEPQEDKDFSDLLYFSSVRLTESDLFHGAREYVPQHKDTQYRRQELQPIIEGISKNENVSIDELGRLLFELKQKHWFVTGRTIKGIVQAIVNRSADFDIPPSWFEKRAEFLDRSYEEKVTLLKSLYQTVTPEMIYEEIEKYFVERKVDAEEEEKQNVQRIYQNKSWDTQAQIRYYMEEIAKGDKSAAKQLHDLRVAIQKLMQS